MKPRTLLALSLATFACHCGGSTSAPAQSTPDAATPDAGTGTPGTTPDAGTKTPGAPPDGAPGTPKTDAGPPDPGTGPDASMEGGVVDAGAPGTHADASDACTRGACLGETRVTGTVDVSQATATTRAGCTSEALTSSVVALGAKQATLAAAPGTCLAAGDEVILINQQGTASSTASVGNWELLTIATVDGATVTFTRAKTRDYGDDEVGAGAADQKVALVRVAEFGTMTIGDGGVLTTGAWDGTTGGVLALRAAKLTVGGTISVAGLGYRCGRWSSDDASCTENIATESGESIGGPPVVSTSHQFGAPGGLGAENGVSFISDSPVNSGAGHSGSGETGANGKGRTVGAPGVAYGAGDASRLTMGSGASGNITCQNNFSGPALIPVFEQLAGGIVIVFADELTVLEGGKITASALQGDRDLSASGGYVFLSGTKLDVGTNAVTANGGVSVSTNVATVDVHVHSSDGYVVLEGTVTGTTSPAAHQL